jgi:hypothetical protein
LTVDEDNYLPYDDEDTPDMDWQMQIGEYGEGTGPGCAIARYFRVHF